MTFDVLVYKIITNYSGTWDSDMGSHTLSADNYIHVLLDDVTETFIVKYQASPEEGINILGTLTEGPHLFFGFDGAVTLMTSAPYYQWCDSTTLNKVNVLNNFPYAFLSFFPDAAECAIAPTCDLEISSLYSTTDATGPSTADGSLTVSATGTNGTIKFSLDPDFDYATAGQTSGTFSGLLPDTYTIYAKDAIGCLDNITIEIKVTTVYGVRHRLERVVDVMTKIPFQVDIEERAYVGPILEMCGEGKSPVIVSYKGDQDDPSRALYPSNVQVTVLVETEGQYTHLHLGDDRQFRLKLYAGDSLDLYHVGYIVPEFHSEPYLFTPYGLDITSSDQLGEMENLDFVDVNGNKFKGDLKLIKVIAEVLKKTDLNLPIRSVVNVFEENMYQTADDDPLDQVFLDSRIYLSSKNVPVKCDEVLLSIGDSPRATIFQSMGYWWILRWSEGAGELAYREFDANGDFVSSGTLDPVKQLHFPSASIEGAVFSGRSQVLSFMRNYGYFEITNDLRKDGNLIDEGRFEEEDIIDLGSGNKTFLNWNYLIGQPGATAGFEAVVNGDSLGAAFLDFTSANNPQMDSVWYSKVIPMDDFGALRLKFQYLIAAHYNVPYVRIAWGLKLHRVDDAGFIWLTIGANGVVEWEVSEQRNEIYVEKFNEWQTFEIYKELNLSQPTDSAQIFLYAHNHYGRDFPDETTMRAFDLGGVSNPNGFRAMLDGDTSETNIYTSSPGLTTEDDFPNVIVPDNHSGLGRDWVWRLDTIILIGPNASLVDRAKFDNVSLAFYPLVFEPVTQYVEPQETLIYSELVNQFVESDLEKTVLLGDMIRYNEEFTRNEHNLYRSYLRFEDGTPTRFWARAGVSESKNLLQILLEDYIAQFSTPQRRLSGTMVANTIIHFVNCLRDNIDGIRYRPMTFQFDVKNAAYTMDLVALTTGEDGAPVNEGQFYCRAFSSAFRRGTCIVGEEDGIFDETFDETFN